MGRRKSIRLEPDGYDYKYFRSHVRKLPTQSDKNEVKIAVEQQLNWMNYCDTWEGDLIDDMVFEFQKGEFNPKEFERQLHLINSPTKNIGA